VNALPLACTVRGCGQPLTRHGAAYDCPRGHSYDVARSGYLNLLQPQDRKAAVAGDRRQGIDARARLERAGVGRALVDALVRRIGDMNLAPGAVAVDLGSGTGRALATIAAAHEVAAVGIDLSVAAATHAARHWPALAWVVANADRTLPLLTGCADVVLSLHARRNPAEVARVLKPAGVFLAAVPAPDDLIELRAVVQGEGITRDRVPALVAEHEPLFVLDATVRVAARHRLEPELLRALLDASYRGARRSAADRVAALGALDVTLSSDVCVLKPRGDSRIDD